MRANISKRRVRRKIHDSFNLNLTPLLDVMVIILVFLLKSATVSTVQFSYVPGLELPLSTSPTIPPESLHLTVTPEAMVLEDERILDFLQSASNLEDDEVSYKFRKEDLSEAGQMIVPLYQALIAERENAETLLEESRVRDEEGNPSPWIGELAIQADRRIEYDTLRRVMYTAGAAGYQVFHLLAVKLEE